MDPGRAPQRVGRAHLVDERPNGRRGAGPARTTVPRAVRPSASESLPMPTDHRLGLHNDQGRTPVPPGVSELHPKQSISRTEWRTLDRALEHRQLLTEGQVLKRDRAVSATDQRQGTEYDKKRGQHERSCAAIDQRINQSLTIRVLANDRIVRIESALNRCRRRRFTEDPVSDPCSPLRQPGCDRRQFWRPACSGSARSSTFLTMLAIVPP